MIKTETDKHQGNGAHDEDAQDRKVKPRKPLHPPLRNIAVWGPIAAVTFVAILVILGAWHRVSQRREEKDFVQRTTELQVNVATAQRDAKPKELVLPGTIDVGTLVTAGTGNAGTPLFSMVQSDPLRVYVFVPQTNAASMREGLKAKILVQERPGQNFEGTVTRTAGALDPTSRTMQVEVQVPNHEGKLYAGMYGQVKFLLPDDNAPIVVPANAFLFRATGPQVVTVTNGNRIHIQKISVGRDFGTQLEVIDGLAEK